METGRQMISSARKDLLYEKYNTTQENNINIDDCGKDNNFDEVMYYYSSNRKERDGLGLSPHATDNKHIEIDGNRVID